MTIACCPKYLFAAVLAQHCLLFSTSAAYSLGEDASRTKVEEDKSVQRHLRAGTSENNIFQTAGGMETLVVGGQTAISNRYPYYAYLKTGERLCGGSLIAPDLILTAASCRGMATAQVGRNDLFSFEDEYDSLGIIEEFVHPSYDPGDESKQFDILLLKLSGRSNSTLVSLNFDPAVPSTQGQRLVVAGFGYMDNSSTLPSRLRSATLGYLPNDVCSTKSSAEFNMSDTITTDMLCAGGDGIGVCSGDYGGPLLILGNSAEDDILVGTVSWGTEPCGELPGVFQRTSESSEWIKETVCVNSIDVPWGYCPSPAPSASLLPSVPPTIAPTTSPSGRPSMTPSTIKPSSSPSIEPSFSPSGLPSDAPSLMPSDAPSLIPSDAPSVVPSESPSISVAPSSSPSSMPSDAPSPTPTISTVPTPAPTTSVSPSMVPSVVPSVNPTDEPTKQATPAPSQALVTPTFSPIEYKFGSVEASVDSAWSIGDLSVFRYTSTVVLAATLFQFL